MPPAFSSSESSRIVVGYDPAGRVDNTGVAVALVHETEMFGRRETVYEVVDLQGLHLLWEDQHQYLAKFLHKLHVLQPAIAQRGITVNIDVGSGGRYAHGILSRYQSELLPPRTTLTAFSITGADGWKTRPEVGPHEYSIGHKPLIERVLILVDPTYKRLFLPDNGATRALLDELRNVELKVDPLGHDRIVTRSGKHDDRVFALALAVTDAGYHGVLGSRKAIEAFRNARLTQPLYGMTGGETRAWINGGPADGSSHSWELGPDGRLHQRF